MTDPNSRLPRAGFSNHPRTAVEFAEYSRKSETGELGGNRRIDGLYRDMVKPDVVPKLSMESECIGVVV